MSKDCDCDNEGRAEREYERWRRGSGSYSTWQFLTTSERRFWREYVKDLPSRPIREPGHVLHDAICRAAQEYGYDAFEVHSFGDEDSVWQSIMEDVAEELNIKESE